MAGSGGNFTTEVKPGGAPMGSGSAMPTSTNPAAPIQPISARPQYQPQYQQLQYQQPIYQPQQRYQPNYGLQNLYNMFMNNMQASGLQNLYGAGTFNRPRAPLQPYIGSTYRPDLTSARAKLNDVAPSVATEQARAAAEEARRQAEEAANRPQQDSGGGGG